MTAAELDRCECKTPAPRRIWGGSLECQRCRRIIPAIQLRLAIR